MMVCILKRSKRIILVHTITRLCISCDCMQSVNAVVLDKTQDNLLIM